MKNAIKKTMRRYFYNLLSLTALCILLACSRNAFAQCNIITTVAGTGTSGYSGDGGAATAATMDFPFGIKVDGSGNIYFADYAGQRVRKVSASGIISTVAGNGTGGYAGDGGAATAAELNAPYDVALDATGNIYIADGSNNCIRKVSTSGIISTVAGTATGGYSGDGGPATAAKINHPYGIAIDGSGNIYIADEFNNRIRMVNTSGIMSTVAGNGTGAFAGDGGPATAAELNGPQGVAVDAAGNIYIADQSNSRIRKVSASGIMSTVAGNGTFGTTGDGGAATAAEIYSPVGVAVDHSGNVYFTDYSSRIRYVNTSGIVNTITGTGTAGYSGDGGAASAAEINTPLGVFVDASNNIYISDGYNSRIRKITTGTPVVAAITGPTTVTSGSSITLSDATSGGTWSSSASSIATVSSSGSVVGVGAGSATISYSVTNSCGTTVVTYGVTVTGGTGSSCNIITTIAGNGTEGFSGDGGAATAA